MGDKSHKLFLELLVRLLNQGYIIAEYGHSPPKRGLPRGITQTD
jgi:hypothetical protein